MSNPESTVYKGVLPDMGPGVVQTSKTDAFTLSPAQFGAEIYQAA